MKKKILSLIVLIGILIISCTREPILNKNEYKIVDTISTTRNGFDMILGYDVIVKYDSAFYYGFISPVGNLTFMNHRKIDIKRFK